MNDDLFDRLMEGTREAGAISRGEQAPARVTTRPVWTTDPYAGCERPQPDQELLDSLRKGPVRIIHRADYDQITLDLRNPPNLTPAIQHALLNHWSKL